MTLQCVIFLFQLRTGGYISKGIFCPIFIKVKEINVWILYEVTSEQAFSRSSYSSQLATCKLRLVFISSDQSRQTICKQISACNLQADMQADQEYKDGQNA